ncbi:Protein dehydration-induced 19-like 7 [Vitis vinifera]|uniref:Protein dehydration-induced 19-like 7 n=1 Tax=Vitis vinifera TaxID=29760 RepID=A0A438DWW1_VITVI|nr:Protein dehydration-induced 19-like 7 [Vitis vinifera]
MDSDFAARFSILSKRFQSRSDLYLERGGEEFDGDEECLPEFLCPFCAEDFDVVGLCCHIDEEHPVEAKNGVRGLELDCRLYVQFVRKEWGWILLAILQCNMEISLKYPFSLELPLSHVLDREWFVPSKLSPVPCNFMALICMITMMLYYSLTNDYVQRRRRFRRGGSNSTFSILRKELRDGNLQSIFGGSSRIVSSSNSEPDPLLSSFMYNAPVVVEPVVVQPDSSAEASVVKESSDEGFSERNIQKPQLSDKEQEEKARRCEFVQGLLLSTILEDSL